MKKIEVLFGDTSSFKMEVDASGSVLELKQMISQEFFVYSVDDLKLYSKGCEVMIDNMNLNTYNVQDRDQIQVELMTHLKINVLYLSQNHIFDIDSSAIVAELKEMVCERWDLSEEHLELQCYSLQDLNLKNDLLLSSYNIRDGDRILVSTAAGVETEDIVVQAKMVGGEEHSIFVKNTDLILTVKEKIQIRTDIASEEQQLMYRGELLKNDQKLWQCGLNGDGCVVNVVIRNRSDITVHATTPDGQTVSFLIVHTCTIAEVKSKIQGLLGWSPVEQRLEFYGEILEDEHTVEHYAIVDESEINVVRSDITVHATTPDGQTVSFLIVHTCTIAEVKSKIQGLLGWSPVEQRLEFYGEILEDEHTVEHYAIVDESEINVVRSDITVHATTPDGQTVSFLIVHTCTIAEVKSKIQGLLGWSPVEQRLEFHGKILKDENTVEHYAIVDESEINVVRNEKISTLKKNIQMQTKLTPDEQELLFQGQELEDEKTVEDYQIVDKSDLYLSERLKLIIKTQGVKDKMEIYVKSKTTVRDLKMILDQVEVTEQRLYFKRKLMDDYLNLRQYEIKSGDTIEMFRMRSVKVRVQDNSGMVAVIEISKKKSVSDMKCLIERKFNLTTNPISLEYNGKMLIDNHSVGNYGFQNMDLVEIISEIS